MNELTESVAKVHAARLLGKTIGDLLTDEWKPLASAIDNLVRASVPQAFSKDRFPVLRQETKAAFPSSVPWAFAETFRGGALKNHSQSLETLFQRGGLAPEEIWCAARGTTKLAVTEADAIAWMVEASAPFEAQTAEIALLRDKNFAVSAQLADAERACPFCENGRVLVSGPDDEWGACDTCDGSGTSLRSRLADAIVYRTAEGPDSKAWTAADLLAALARRDEHAVAYFRQALSPEIEAATERGGRALRAACEGRLRYLASIENDKVIVIGLKYSAAELSTMGDPATIRAAIDQHDEPEGATS